MQHKTIAEMIVEYESQLKTVNAKIRQIKLGKLSVEGKDYIRLLSIQRSLKGSLADMQKYREGK